MLAIAGQTAKSNKLKFFRKPMGTIGVIQPKKFDFFLRNFDLKKNPQATPGT